MIEYRYKSNLVVIGFSVLFMSFAVITYIISMIAFINERSLSDMFVYTLFMGMFVYMFRYIYLVYIKREPVLIVMEDHIIFYSPIGLRKVMFTEMVQMDLKKTMFVYYLRINSTVTSPISLRITKLDSPSEEVYDELQKRFSAHKLLKDSFTQE